MDFKPFDKVIYRRNITSVWKCALYGHYDQLKNQHFLVGGLVIENNEIHPFNGNEYLVGTNKNLKESLIKIGEYCAFGDSLKEIKDGPRIRRLANISSYVFEDSKHIKWNYCISYDRYNPNLSLEDLKRVALKIRNGEVTPYLE